MTTKILGAHTPSNLATYMNSLRTRMKLDAMEDWYSIKPYHIADKEGRQWLKMHDNSIAKLVVSAFPQCTWHPWRFGIVHGYWDNPRNITEYVDWLGRKLRYESMEDWYGVSIEDFETHGGSTPLKKYSRSAAKVVMSVYPNYDWQPWRFQKVGQGFWKRRENVVKYVHWLGEKMAIDSMERWYDIRIEDFKNNWGVTLLKRFKWIVGDILMYVYPEHAWQPWRFGRVRREHWNEQKNVLEYMEWLGRTMNLSSMEDWYRLKVEDVERNGGKELLVVYRQSPALLVSTSLPGIAWQLWRFSPPPPGLWNDRSNELNYLEWLGKKLGYRKYDDWYQVRKKDFTSHCGSTLLEKYQHSPSLLVSSIYSEFTWQMWRFAKMGKQYLANPTTLRRYFEEVGPLVGRITVEDWQTASSHCLMEHKLSILLKVHGTLQNALRIAYPDHDWNFSHSSQGQSLLRRHLSSILKEIGCTYVIQENIRLRGVKNVILNRAIELDLFIPKLNLAFEYHGGHHFQQTHRGDLTEQKRRDKEKLEACDRLGITLVCVPYDWSEALDDLRATIDHYRPDFFPTFGSQRPQCGSVIPTLPRTKVDDGCTNGLQQWKKMYFELARVSTVAQVGDNYVLKCTSLFEIPFEIGMLRQPTVGQILAQFQGDKEVVITIQHYGLSPKKEPLLPSCVQVHPDVSWEGLVTYKVTLPTNPSSKQKITCYACRQKMMKGELTITTNIYHKFAAGGWKSITVAFHPKEECLLRKLQLYHKQLGKTRNMLKPFMNAVALDPIERAQLSHNQRMQLVALEKAGILIKDQRSFTILSDNHDEIGDLCKVMNTHGLHILPTPEN